ncbi:MAG: hypothetical protein IIW52_05705, partial [Alistipes sp.]|nr:hypothetical protein [Alistipes sp.]
EIVPGFDGEENPDISIVTFNDVDTDAELLTALTVSEDHVKHIIVNLTGDVTYDVNAWQACAMGGKLTEDITINGNNNTLTFNHNNTDWNNVVTNGAKLVLNNLNLTNSGKNDGPWNRHDITFNCPVELNNVTSDKAIALGENAVLKNVTIVETGDVYGLWIRAKEATVRSAAGISVEIDGLSIESGRAIKIADEYIDNPACVSLSVKNAKFKTNKKAAILVTSTAGANIVWGDGNDISEVAADNVFAVWVDEERKAYAHLVEVSGADVRLEDAAVVDTQDELNAAIAAGGHIMLAEGEYTFNGTAKDITIIGTGNVANIILNQVNKTPNCSGKNVSFENITFKNGTANYKGIQHSGDVSYKNCVIEGQIFLYGTSETFEGCTFKVTGNVYNVWTYGAGNVTFKNCEFNCEGKSLLIYHESAKVYNVTVDDCTFKSTVTKDDKSAIQMHTEYGITGVLKINDTTATGFANINNGLWNELNNQTGVLTNVFEKYVDGVRVYNDVVVNTDKSVYTIYSAAGLKWFANEVNVNNQTFDGKTVKLANDIDLNNELWAPIGQTGAKTFNGVFDGQNHTISNLNVDSSSQTGDHYSSGLFGWVESHSENHGHLKNVKISGATITGHHNCGALVGYITQETALVENCHVTGATISCTMATSEANGDKAGALIGNATVATPVKNCTATDSTVSAGRDAGQVIGAAKEANVTGCSATNVTVTANGTSTGANINNAVIGRLL